jgi:nicotinamide riboside transporter PnuC
VTANQQAALEIAGWTITVVAVAGVWLNNRRRAGCFWLWMFSNVLSAAVHLAAGLHPLAVRDLIFFALAIDGLRRWRKA